MEYLEIDYNIIFNGKYRKKYLSLEELVYLEKIIKEQKKLIKTKKIEKIIEEEENKKPELKEIRILTKEEKIEMLKDRHKRKELPQWIKDFEISYTEGLEKVQDTSQYEIENGLKKEYPFELASGEIVHNKNEFLKSDYWHFIKETYKQKRGKKEGIKRSYYVCEKCGSLETTNLHLHHLTYKNLGHEKAEELIRICYKCHSEIHGNEPVNKKEYEIQRRSKTSEIEQGLSFESIFPFKKYKGLTVREVVEKDINYIKWIITNTDLKFNEEVFNAVMT